MRWRNQSCHIWLYLTWAAGLGARRVLVLLPVMSEKRVAHRAACSGWASRASILRARLSGERSARKARTSADAHPSGLARLEGGVLGGGDGQAGDIAAAGLADGAGGDPVAEEPELPGARAEAPAAAVGDLSGGLEQKETAVGVERVDAPAGK